MTGRPDQTREENHDVSDTKYRGRHRTRRGGLSPRLVGTGLVLPTTATLAVVTVTGGAGAPLALTSGALTTGASLEDVTDDEAEITADKAADSALMARGVQGRVARDSERSRLDTVSAENAKRAASEAALAAQEAPVQVSLVGAPSSKATTAAASLKTVAVGSKAWTNPIAGSYQLSSNYGWRWGRMHYGQDMACDSGTPIRAISSGVVQFAGWAGNLGYKVEILHWDGTVSWYGHNSRLKVAEGQRVDTGQLIALAGSTGRSTGPHLHLEIHPNGGNAVPVLRWMSAHGVKL